MLWDYSGFGTKLNPFFRFAKSFQMLKKLSIKHIVQIRCSGCYVMFFIRIKMYILFLNVNKEYIDSYL